MLARRCGSALHLALQVTLCADVLDQAELGLQPINVLFLVVQDVLEQVTADVISDALAVGDRLAQILHRGQFQIRSEEHTSELQSLMRISYAVFCLNNKNRTRN